MAISPVSAHSWTPSSLVTMLPTTHPLTWLLLPFGWVYLLSNSTRNLLLLLFVVAGDRTQGPKCSTIVELSVPSCHLHILPQIPEGYPLWS